jgi:NDP-sugar pyrophosphorylase family protein
MKNQAIILAGGKGKRLRPYTATIPKPLVPIGDFPILEIVIRQLKYYGFKDIVISTGHLAELVEAYFKEGSKWGVNIRYVREQEPLGTAGAIKNIPGLEDNFVVMNGDILTNIDYRDLFNFHLKHKGIATIATAKREVFIDFGVIETDNQINLTNYIEKPRYFKHVSAGINVFNKKCKKYINSGETIGMPELMLRMLDNHEQIYCYNARFYWLDIGRIEDFQRAQIEFEKNKKKFVYE